MWNFKKWWSDITKPAQGQADPPLPETSPLDELRLSEKEYLIAFYLRFEQLKFAGRDADAEETYSVMMGHAKDLLGDNPLLLIFEAREARAAGLYKKAEAAYRLMAELAKELADNNPIKGAAIGNLGIFYQEEGRFADAEPLLHRSLEIFRNMPLGEHYPPYANTLQLLGELYEATGRKTEARECYKQVAAIRRPLSGK
jgi:tetratricopeptide (TPR) repeat protein